MSSLAVPSPHQVASPIPNGTRAILKQDVVGFYNDQQERKVKHTVEKDREVLILSSNKRHAPTRGSTGMPDNNVDSGYEYLLQVDLPEKEWEQFQEIRGIITHQPIPHHYLSNEKTTAKTAQTAKNLGSIRQKFWSQSKVAYVRYPHEYKVGQQHPSGVITLNLGDCILVRSGPLTQSKGTVIKQVEPQEHNLKKAHYNFQQVHSIGMKVPTWTSEYYHDPSSFEVITSST